MKKLRFYQHCAAQYIYARLYLLPKFYVRKNRKIQTRFDYFILADEGGLGKTVTTISVLNRVAEEQKGKIFLIIVPSGLRENWIDEIHEWLPPKEKRKYTVLIESYNSLMDPVKARWIYNLKIDLLIIDEAHYLKSFNAIRTQIIYGAPGEGRKIITRAKKTICLSANIIANHVGEIYPLYWAVKSHVIENMTEYDFLNVFAASKKHTNFGGVSKWSSKGVAPGMENALLRGQRFYLRRIIDDVDKQIAQGIREHINIKIDAKLLKEEKEYGLSLHSLLSDTKLKQHDLDDMLDDPEYFNKTLSAVPNFVEYQEFRKRQGMLKIKPVFDYLKENVFTEHTKFILCSVHVDVANTYYDLVSRYYKKIGKDIEIILVTGQVDSTVAHALLKKANSLEECVLIVTLGKVREGHNLQKFRHSYTTELDWRYYVHIQFEYRTRRIGSTKTMFWYYFLFEQGIDKQIFKTMETKKKTLKQVYG